MLPEIRTVLIVLQRAPPHLSQSHVNRVRNVDEVDQLLLKDNRSHQVLVRELQGHKFRKRRTIAASATSLNEPSTKTYISSHHPILSMSSIDTQLDEPSSFTVGFRGKPRPLSTLLIKNDGSEDISSPNQVAEEWSWSCKCRPRLEPPHFGSAPRKIPAGKQKMTDFDEIAVRR